MNWVQNHLCTENSSIFLLNWTHLHKVIGEIQQAQEGRTWYWLRNNNASYSISNTFSCRNENNYVYTHTQPHTTFSMTEKDNMLTGYLLRLYIHSQMAILEPSFYSLCSLLLLNYKLLSELLCSTGLHLAAQSQFLCKNLNLNKEMCISNRPKGR